MVFNHDFFFHNQIKFRYSEKATKFGKKNPFCPLLSNVKKIGIFFQKVAFSEYLNFNNANEKIRGW